MYCLVVNIVQQYKQRRIKDKRFWACNILSILATPKDMTTGFSLVNPCIFMFEMRAKHQKELKFAIFDPGFFLLLLQLVCRSGRPRPTPDLQVGFHI